MDKWVLVTGGFSEIGREISIFLASSGCNIFLHYFSKSEIEISSFVKQLESFGICVIAIKSDFSKEEDLSHLVKTVRRSGHKLSGIVHNAGIHEKFLLDNEVVNFTNLYKINVYAPIYITRELKDEIISSNDSVVILISSPNIDFNMKLSNIFYSTSKSTYKTMSIAFAKELKPIRSCVVVPGYLDTSFFRSGKKETDIDLFKKRSLQNKLTDISDIAKTVGFIFQNHSINATLIKVDTGYGKE